MITPPKHTLKQMVAAWKEQVRATADKPWLFTLLMRQWDRLFRRFAYYYQRLLALPRPHKRALKRTLATTLAGAALLLALGQPLPAHAGTINVDGIDCTLAEAIDSANKDKAEGNGCTDGSGADVINLVQTTVTLQAALPAVRTEITIQGMQGTPPIIDGVGQFRVLEVKPAGILTLKNITITGGKAPASEDMGGGILNSGKLTVNNSTISGNSAFKGGGVFNYGILTVNEGSTFSKNKATFGGGIYNSHSTNNMVTLNKATMSRNSASQDGGGIFNYRGTVEVNNDSRIGGDMPQDANMATGEFARGGGIFNEGGKVTVNRSTLQNNSATHLGGGVFNHGTLIVNDQSKFIENKTTRGGGGGIWNDRNTVELNNSTLSGNTSATGSGGGISDFYGTVNLNNSTLSGNKANRGSGGGISTLGGIIKVNDSTLSDNSAVWGGGIQNLYGTVEVNHSTLSNNPASQDGGGIMNYGGTVRVINDSTLSNNSASRGGGIFNYSLYNYGILEVNNSTLSGNSAVWGGGIFNKITLIINNSTLNGNSTTDGDGGGIFNKSGKVTVNNSTLSGNVVPFHNGGGIFNSSGGTVMMNNSTLSQNSAPEGSGGGVYNTAGSVVILERSLISGNKATVDGAEVYNQGTAIVRKHNVFGYSNDDRSTGQGFDPVVAPDIIPTGALVNVLDTTLGENGGPTLTHALKISSAALDVALNTACDLTSLIKNVDQRGYPRNENGKGFVTNNECDAGSFEYQDITATLTIETPQGFVVGNLEHTMDTESATSSANPLMNMFVIAVLAVGNLFLLRKGHS